VTDPAHVERTPTPVTLRRHAGRRPPAVHAWLQRPHIVLWWGSNDGSLSRDEIRARHLPGKDAGVSVHEKAGFRAINRIVTPAGAAIRTTQVRPENETCDRPRTAR
jgi:hypothetical protein